MMRLIFASLVLTLAGCGAGRAVADPASCRDRYLALADESSWTEPTCLAFSPESGAVVCMSRREVSAGYERRSVVVLARDATPIEYVLVYEADLGRMPVEERAEPRPDKIWTVDELAGVLEQQALCEPIPSPTELVDQKWLAVGGISMRLELENHVEEDWTWSTFMVHGHCGDASAARHLAGGAGLRVRVWSTPGARRHVLITEEVESGEGIFEQAWTPRLVDEAMACSPP